MTNFLQSISLDQNLSIKKLDPDNRKDVWLVKQLDKDELVCGANGYLWPIHTCFNDTRYLYSDNIYNSPYAIYDGEKPVGYVDLSDIVMIKKVNLVDIAYAILKEERKKGYATKTLLEITKRILIDPQVEKTTLTIAKKNIESQKVAERAGYIKNTSIPFQFYGVMQYQKTKRQI